MKRALSPKRIDQIQNLEDMTDDEKRLADLLHYKKTGKRLIKPRKKQKQEKDYEGIILKRDIKNPHKKPKKGNAPLTNAVVYKTATFVEPKIKSGDL